LRADRHRVRFLDELIRGLDRVADRGMTVWLMAPAQRILGMDWVAPYLVKGSLNPKAAPVFVDGKMRTLRPFMWWADPSIVQRRLGCFRELTAALCGHPALSGWVVMDRVLDWPRPEFQTADLVLKSYCAEIRDRDETGDIFLSTGPSELLDPEMVQLLNGQVDGLLMRGVEGGLDRWGRCNDLTDEISLTAYLYSMAQWLFEKKAFLEMGWSMMAHQKLREKDLASADLLVRQGVSGITWLHLIDPDTGLRFQPPWSQRPGLENTGMLDQAGDPKDGMESLIREIRATGQGTGITDFIDIDMETYLADPHTHLRRLWDHFQESI